MFYIGIDPSLASLGVSAVARPSYGPGDKYSVGTQAFHSEPVGQKLDARHARITRLAASASHGVVQGDIVAIERMFNAPGAGTVERAWLWGSIVSRLVERGARLLEVPPGQLKKFATGGGRADKAAVIFGVSKMWPDWTPSSSRSAGDEADALTLASMALCVFEEDVPFAMHAYRVEVRDKIRKANEL